MTTPWNPLSDTESDNGMLYNYTTYFFQRLYIFRDFDDPYQAFKLYPKAGLTTSIIL